MRRGLMKSIHGFISGKGGGHSTFGTAQGNCQGAAQVLGGRRLFAKHIAGHVTLRTIQHTNQSIHSHTNRPYTQREHSFTQSIYPVTYTQGDHPYTQRDHPHTQWNRPTNQPESIQTGTNLPSQSIHLSIHSRKETTRPSDTPINLSNHTMEPDRQALKGDGPPP